MLERLEAADGDAELLARLEIVHRDFVGGCHAADGFGTVGGERAIGDSPQRGESHAGLTERIVFTGHRSDMREIYAISDCVLSLSSTPESFGRTVLEPLAMGRPVVGYAHGGVAEILAELFAHGAVAKGDVGAATLRAEAVLKGKTPAVLPNTRFLLGQMQTSTLSLYEALTS